MQDLRVTIIQSNLHWENTGANLAMFEEKIWQIGESTDVIVLPEMFSTGFSMNAPGLAEVMNQQTFKWMKQMADQTGALLLASFIVKENGNYFNRLLWMEPGGSHRTYDKRHLFRMAQEHRVYAAGTQKLVAEWRGWKICPLVCYDLRFPVWSRNRKEASGREFSYDALVYVANWPQARIAAWDTLLRARAIENLSFTIGVNRVGSDGLSVAYNGHSAVVGPRGDVLLDAGDGEAIRTISLQAEVLLDHRTRFPANLDSDNFNIL